MVDPEWLELVEADVREHLSETSLKDFPIIPFPAVSGYNMDVLKKPSTPFWFPPETVNDNPILWIDRVFTIKGAGTVVTGTLMDGSLRSKDGRRNRTCRS